MALLTGPLPLWISLLQNGSGRHKRMQEMPDGKGHNRQFSKRLKYLGSNVFQDILGLSVIRIMDLVRFYEAVYPEI